ncbi:ataxin-1-like [Astyanax mexicanus]|uniref:Ataxin 1 n=1 Tax=Astyanax mexicanus TaxID=7994 RepID=A0A8B9GSP9_ASTMX|nr:ataxin-1-like [Astyanax mexicanus]
MNPSPDRGKECLPPKKRESRQGSSEQRPLEDDFKHPAPIRSWRLQVSEGRESGGDSRFDKDPLLPPPPPPPPLPPLPLPLPWHVPYPSSIHHPFLPGQAGERRGPGSPSWRDSGAEPPPIPHHSRWLRGDISPLGLQQPISVPTFKSAYAVESRDMWPYFGHTRREYSPSLFSSHHPFPQPPVYTPDLLPDSRLRYPSRRPNGLDGHGSRSESSARLASGGDCGNDSRSRPVGSSHSNGRKRHQEDPAGRSTGRSSLSQEGPNAHSFLQELDRDPGTLGMPKPPNPHAYTSDSRTGKASTPHEPPSGSASQTGAQIYYSLGSLYPSAHQNPQAIANLSPSGPPPSPLRNSQHSPHSQHNNHGTDQERELSPASYRPSVSILSGPDPPPSAVLPHFAKGSLIELAGGRLKRVEELRTEDFLHSADTSPEFHLSTCTILLISPGPTNGFNHLQVRLADRNTQELLTVLEEYPFFVRDRGWSSCSPQRSAQLYGLPCRQLSAGDVCLALTPTPTSAPPTSNRPHQSRAQHRHGRAAAGSEVRPHGSERMPPPTGPPLPPSAQAPPPDSRGQEKPRPRKRRWSAPELQAGAGTRPDLPQDCKRVRQQ